MNTEIQAIIRDLGDTLNGDPWYGKAVYTLLEKVNPEDFYKKPSDNSHSVADLLYHMLNWAQFTLENVRGNPDVKDYDKDEFDWRIIHPAEHSLDMGIAQLKATYQQLTAALQEKDDAFLEQTAIGREYNYRVLLNGIIQHNIYHAGQIAYLEKLPLKF